MQTTISATFAERVGARDAISDLVRFGLKAADISVAEREIGLGTVFGTAQTFSPGRGSTDLGTILQPAYPMGASGGMPAGIVATDRESVTVSLMDFGLSKRTATDARMALEAGAVVLAVTVDDRVAKAAGEILERNGGLLAALA